MNKAQMAELLAEIFLHSAQDDQNAYRGLCQSLHVAAEQVARRYNELDYPCVPVGTVDLASLRTER